MRRDTKAGAPRQTASEESKTKSQVGWGNVSQATISPLTPPLAVLRSRLRQLSDIPKPRPEGASAAPTAAMAEAAEANAWCLPEKWRNTTPLGREIIRKKLYALKKKRRQAEEQFGLALKRLSELLPPELIAVSGGRTGKAGETEPGYIRAAQFVREQHNEIAYLQAQEQLAETFADVSSSPKVTEHSDKVAFHDRVASEIRKHLALGRDSKDAGGLSCISSPANPQAAKEASAPGPTSPPKNADALARMDEPEGETGVTVTSAPLKKAPKAQNPLNKPPEVGPMPASLNQQQSTGHGRSIPEEQQRSEGYTQNRSDQNSGGICAPRAGGPAEADDKTPTQTASIRAALALPEPAEGHYPVGSCSMSEARRLGLA